MPLVAFACIFEALCDTCQEIKDRSKKKPSYWVLGVSHLQIPDFPTPILATKKCPSSQMGGPILIQLEAFACIFEALYDTCQKIKN